MATKGTLIKPGALMLRVSVGSVRTAEGLAFELDLSMNKTPLVKSAKTGVTFNLTWEDIIQLAIERGVNEEFKE